MKAAEQSLSAALGDKSRDWPRVTLVLTGKQEVIAVSGQSALG